MDKPDTYKTIISVSEGLFKDKGSRFISRAFPVSDEQDVKKYLEEIRKTYHDARHHCYAYILGKEKLIWRANDDGEPSGTAGRPILGQIRSADLTNVLIIVTRYFGGTLLGVSGLINAYKLAASDAIANSEIIDHIVHINYELTFPYLAMNDVMKIIKDEAIGQSGHAFGDECKMLLSFRESAKDRILERLGRIENVSLRFLYEK